MAEEDDDVRVYPPMQASPETLALYNEDPSMWPDVRGWKKATQIKAEMRRIDRTLAKHPTCQSEWLQRTRNKRKLLLAKLSLFQCDQPEEMRIGFAPLRRIVRFSEAPMFATLKRAKRHHATFLMELSKFIGTFLEDPEITIF